MSCGGRRGARCLCMYRNISVVGGESPLFESPTQAEIAGWQCVRVAKCSHRNIGCRPRPYSRKVKQLFHRLFTVSITVEHQAILNNGASKCLYRVYTSLCGTKSLHIR